MFTNDVLHPVVPVSLPVLRNPVITYSAAQQSHQKGCVTVASIKPKTFIFTDQFLGAFVGKGNKTLLIHNCCTLHSIYLNNSTSYRGMESSAEFCP